MEGVKLNEILVLSPLQIVLAYAFAIMVLFLVRYRGVRREREILISTIRMTVQLILTGYILAYVLDHPSPWITAGIILLMEGFAIFTIIRKFRQKMTRRLKEVVAFSLAAGTMSCLLYFLLVVVRINPWYDPQYFIPIAGMFVGNTMTAVSLGSHALIEGMTVQKAQVEEALILGATPKQATASIIDSTLESAIMPTLNTMIGMGVVFLPGMMTGQILSGTSPTTAVTYQLAVMLGILGAVALSVILLLQLGYRCFFTEQDQLLLAPSNGASPAAPTRSLIKGKLKGLRG